ncbi:beta-N-acetylhexosaminidase [Actinotalea sp. M2MS4P-6]|uniref:beta-N-acetylhexosaminidase n=1 Tax=Actinotalea sp. M2MS4P-6 TaxID=2983762 RepID=UPI0021E473A8|nr:beta-N-acetylhexosaminidase [Actinotalea sp. M2MS4P-6]MCV2393756.1 beta-N-acetylhexosaminidase [Actinotalea sp. M2MS4P-6]
MTTLPLLPIPRSAVRLPGSAVLGPGTTVIAPAGLEPVTARLARRLGAALGTPVPVRTDTAGPAAAPGGPTHVRLVLDATADGDDEAYTLTVDDAGVLATASGTTGLRHATTALLQLAEASATHGAAITLPGVRVEDAPRYPWRGFMLDVARHFQDVPTVLAVLEVMADLRLNRLHLHLSDDQGWRVALESHPELAERSSGTEVGGGPGGCYSAAELRTIVETAADLGIVVVPEIDVPGHVNAMLHAVGELNPDGMPTDAYTGIEVGFSGLHADLPATEPFLRDVLTEVATLTGGPWVHLGGDECPTMAHAEYAQLVRVAADAIRSAERAPIGWQEAATTGAVDVVQVWDLRSGTDAVLTAARDGARVLMSPAPHTYLDLKYDADFPLGLEWAGHVPLRQAYEWDPEDVLPGLDPGAIEGVEACLWTETVTCPDDLWALALPRLAAVAEVAWSPRDSRDWADARERLADIARRWTADGLAWTRTPDVDW